MKARKSSTKISKVDWSTRARGALWEDRSTYEECSHRRRDLGPHYESEYVDGRYRSNTFECYDVRRVHHERFAPVDIIACLVDKKPSDVTLKDLADHITRRDLLDRPQVGAGTVDEIADILASANLTFKGATNRCPYCKRIQP